jgi:hypothetical protein
MKRASVRVLAGIMFASTIFIGTAVCEPATDKTGWITLFDGSSLDAWRGYKVDKVPPGWIIEDGLLKHETGLVDLLTRDEFDNFDLRFDWRVAPGANSGVIYRCSETEEGSHHTGPEYQIVDNAGWKLDSLNPHAAGAMYELYPAKLAADRPAGEWNSGRVVVQKNHVEHWLNGKLIVVAEWDSPDWKSRVASSKFAQWKPFGTLSKGHIALQGEPGPRGVFFPVWYRDIKIRRLTDADLGHATDP